MWSITYTSYTIYWHRIMNVEENRLKTFGSWPAGAIVSPSRIAKAGFFSLNRDQAVQCFACGVQITDWEYGDQVMARHRRLNPQCPFVIDPSTSGNVPKIDVPSSSSPAPSASVTAQTSFTTPNLGLIAESLKEEVVRMRTFDRWPVPEIIQPTLLVKSGFYSLRDGDKTKCAFCGGIVGSWESGDDPDKEHKRHFPHCSFVLSVINPRLNATASSSGGGNCNDNNSSEQDANHPVPLHSGNIVYVTEDDLAELGVHTHAPPKKPNFATLESRLRTFASWPEDLIQTPEILSQAGFYYEGCGDHVRCFHCDGGLRHWDPHDDPWTEHARWFPQCAFVQLVKGRDFISACAIEENVGINNIQRAKSKKELLEREVTASMSMSPAITALSIGLSYGRVKQAVREKLLSTGKGFKSADSLIEAALNIQHEEEGEDEAGPESRLVTDILENVLSTASHNKKEGTTVKAPESQQKSEEESNLKLKISLEEENRLLKEARLCKICMDNEVAIVFLPCGHLAACMTCAPNLKDCPVCRSSIKATVRTYLS